MTTGSVTSTMFQQFAMNPTGLPRGPRQIGDRWDCQTPWNQEYSDALFSKLYHLMQDARSGGRVEAESQSRAILDWRGADEYVDEYVFDRVGAGSRKGPVHTVEFGETERRPRTYLNQLKVGSSGRTSVSQTFKRDNVLGNINNGVHMRFTEQDARDFLCGEQMEIYCEESDFYATHPVAMIMSLAVAARFQSRGTSALPVKNLVFERRLFGDDTSYSFVARNVRNQALRLERGGVHAVAHMPMGNDIPDEVVLSIPRQFFGRNPESPTDASGKRKLSSLQLYADTTHYVPGRYGQLEARPLFSMGVDSNGLMNVSALLLMHTDETKSWLRETHYHTPLIADLFHFLDESIAHDFLGADDSSNIGDVFLKSGSALYRMP